MAKKFRIVSFDLAAFETMTWGDFCEKIESEYRDPADLIRFDFQVPAVVNGAKVTIRVLPGEEQMEELAGMLEKVDQKIGELTDRLEAMMDKQTFIKDILKTKLTPVLFEEGQKAEVIEDKPPVTPSPTPAESQPKKKKG